MIRKLNNKGMTAVEILVTFVIIIVIVVSMYNGILDLKNKETISSYKLSLVTYNNLLTKDIQDDLIKIGLSTVQTSALDGNSGYRITMALKDGTKRILEIKQIFGCSAVDSSDVSTLCTPYNIPENRSDEFSISYGPEGDLTEYPLPDLGHEEIDNYDGSQHNGTNYHTVYSLKINEVDVSFSNNVFSVRIVLYHPDLGSKHSIDIVTPINYDVIG